MVFHYIMQENQKRFIDEDEHRSLMKASVLKILDILNIIFPLINSAPFGGVLIASKKLNSRFSSIFVINNTDYNMMNMFLVFCVSSL